VARVRRSAERCTATNAAAPRADAAARGKVKRRKQALAIALSKARKKGKKVPERSAEAGGERDHGGGGAVNFKTANRGIEIPASILLRAEGRQIEGGRKRN
jgi:hypothetical protein